MEQLELHMLKITFASLSFELGISITNYHQMMFQQHKVGNLGT